MSSSSKLFTTSRYAYFPHIYLSTYSAFKKLISATKHSCYFNDWSGGYDLYIDDVLGTKEQRTQILFTDYHVLYKNILITKHLVNSFNDKNNKYDFVVIKILTIGIECRHIAVALWDVKNKNVEIFDSSGGVEYAKIYKYAINILLNILLHNTTTKNKPTVGLANIVNWQDITGDEFCQTWILLWCYYRIVLNYSSHDLLKYFYKLYNYNRDKDNSVGPKLLFAWVSDFRKFLISKTKTKSTNGTTTNTTNTITITNTIAISSTSKTLDFEFL